MEVGDNVFVIFVGSNKKVFNPVQGTISNLEYCTDNFDLFRYEAILLKLLPYIVNNTVNRKLIIRTLDALENNFHSPYTILKVSHFLGRSIDKRFVRLNGTADSFPVELVFQDSNIMNKCCNILNIIFELEECKDVRKYIKTYFK